MIPLSSVILVILGTLGIFAFHIEVYFPIWLSVAILVGVTWYLFSLYRAGWIGVLILVLWAVYAMPFIHIPPYLWYDFSTVPSRLWGLTSNPYNTDKEIVSLTAMLGAVGGLGVAFGVSLNTIRLEYDNGRTLYAARRQITTIAFPVWLTWVAVGVLLSWLATPSETIFTASYTHSQSTLDSANFDSAWMMSYVILTFALNDALLETDPVSKNLKRKIIFFTVALLVVVFQMLRGNRESFSWVFGIAIVYYYWAAGYIHGAEKRVPWMKLGLWVLMLLVFAMVVGNLRSALTGADITVASEMAVGLFQSRADEDVKLLDGTWSGALLTPLSVAGDHVNHMLAIKWGKDYIDYLLSLPPGFIADAIGYVRPISRNVGPAWEMRYGGGGTHAVVLPFMNFRMAGVFFIPALWAYVCSQYERLAVKKVSVTNLSLLVVLVMASPHWLWYGEKNVLNAFILWLIFSLFYRISKGGMRSHMLS